MQLWFRGAAQAVTGSMHMLVAEGRQVLLDCGVYQGHRAESFQRNRTFPFQPSGVDALVLSHAHLDHVGNIPTLVHQGFRENIVCTSATRDLAAAILRDSAHVMASDAEFVSKKRARKGQPPVEPLYTLADADISLRYFVGIAYGRPLQLVPNVRLTFYDAGHILGSAISVLEASEGNRVTRLAYTGDLGRCTLPILRDPQPIPPVDYLIMESTYGNREHGPPEAARERLKEIVLEAYRQNGKVIIPAFAVGRTQAIVYDLHELTMHQEIPSLPIFVDSPLATDVTEIFRLHPECYDEETEETLLHEGDPFGFKMLKYTRSVAESKELNFLRDSAIIISASGMAEAGRILHHLKNGIGDPRNIILFVGYQAENTLGRRLVDGHKEVRIFGEPYEVRAQVEEIDGYSAHADHEGLVDYVRPLAPGLKAVFLVHGEPEASAALAQALRALGISQVYVPEPGDKIELD